MFILLNTLNKTHRRAVLKYAFMVVENALAKERGCYISPARIDLDDLYLWQDKMFVEAITPPNMYAKYKSGMTPASTFFPP